MSFPEYIVTHNGHRITNSDQVRVYRYLATKGFEGATVAQIRRAAARAQDGEHHHGSLSGALSRLHKLGVLVLLHEKRNGNHIYVLPKYQDARPARAPRARSHCPGCACTDV